MSNAYLNKFEIGSPKTQAQLYEVGKSEIDEDVLNQLSLIMAEAPEEEYASMSLVDFLEDPLYFNRRDIRILPAPNSGELEQIISRIQGEEDTEVIKKLF